jgi:hypothetical protein
LGTSFVFGSQDNGNRQKEKDNDQGREEGVASQSVAQYASCDERASGCSESEQSELEAHEVAVERAAEVAAHDHRAHR